MQIAGRHWALALAAAVLMHAGMAAVILQRSSPSGAKSAGFGGIEVSLGPAGGVPSDIASPAIEAPVTEPMAAVEVPAEPSPRETVAKTESTAPPGSPAEVAPIERATAAAEAETSRSQPTKQEEIIRIEQIEPQLIEGAKLTQPSAAEAKQKEGTAARPVIMPPPPTPKPRTAELRRAEVKPEPAPEPAKAQPQGGARTVAPAAEQMATAAPPAPAEDGKAGTQASSKGAGSTDDTAGGGMPGESADYVALLQAWLEKHKEYPRRAQLRRQEGTALLYLIMDREGRVLDYRIQQSSGHDLLDREAVEMIERAQPLPKMPDDMRQMRLELVVPVQFLLR